MRPTPQSCERQTEVAQNLHISPRQSEARIPVFRPSRLRAKTVSSARRSQFRGVMRLGGARDLWRGVVGGAGGIRTHVRVSPKHAFQACAFNHSATAPQRQGRRASRRKARLIEWELARQATLTEWRWVRPGDGRRLRHWSQASPGSPSDGHVGRFECLLTTLARSERSCPRARYNGVVLSFTISGGSGSMRRHLKAD